MSWIGPFQGHGEEATARMQRIIPLRWVIFSRWGLHYFADKMERYSVKKYQDCFDGQVYAHLHFNPDFDYELKTYPEDFLHRMFAEGQVRGKTLLDIGSGPTVRCAISASKYIPNIYLSDLVENNRNEVFKWLKKDPDAIDFTWQFKHVANLEKVSDHHILEDRTRRAIKEVLSCNILEANSIPAKTTKQFDVITSAFCIDCFTDECDCKEAIRNMAALLKPGGKMVLLGTLKCVVTGSELPSATIDQQVRRVREMITRAGLRILVFEEQYIENKKKAISPTLAGEFGTVCVKNRVFEGFENCCLSCIPLNKISK